MPLIGKVYLSPTKSIHSHWKIIDKGNNKVNLQNQKTKLYLIWPSNGQYVTTWITGYGYEWKIIPSGNSSQISIESARGDFLCRTIGQQK